MKEIKMVDLNSQYVNIKPEIDEAIQSVIDSAGFIKGAEVKEFEKELAEYLSCKNVISCGNGTDALQIALMALGLQTGDEVITSDFTFIATAEVIALLGLKPVFVDVSPDTFNLETEELKKAINKNTKAIIPVHLFGQCACMKDIMDIAHENNLFVIEDTAQAMGAEYIFEDERKKAGTIGTIGCTSFFPSKNLGCYGDGGAIMTNDDDAADKMRTIANHGMKTRYYHDIIGVNSRLDTIQAAILRVKLANLEEYNRKRKQAAKYYNDAFSGCDKIIIPATTDYSTHVYHQYTLKLKDTDRKKLQEHLSSKAIPSMVYYPVPLHAQKAFMSVTRDNDKFPVSDYLSQNVISLPMHTEMEEEQQDYIVKTIIEFLTK